MFMIGNESPFDVYNLLSRVSFVGHNFRASCHMHCVDKGIKCASLSKAFHSYLFIYRCNRLKDNVWTKKEKRKKTILTSE